MMNNTTMEELIECVRENEDKIICNGTIYEIVGYTQPSNPLFWVYLFVYIFLVLFAGLMSGLTMGLLSLDILSLEVLMRGGQPNQKKYAKRILTLVRRHHLLLVTLLLANAVAVESMPIFLGKITNEVVAIVVSVTAVLLFGEIIPQAICTRYGLAIGYYCSPLVYLLIAVFFIIAFPLSLVLDLILGKGHSTFFRRAELKHLVEIHGKNSAHKNQEPLNYDEVLIVQSCLEMRDKTVGDCMTPLQSVFMLSVTDYIGAETMDKLILSGHSRVPIYEDTRQNIVGLLLVKRLIKLDPDDCTPIKSLEKSFIFPPSCLTTTPLFDILNKFQEGRSHLYVVYDEKNEEEIVGIITMEDVIEELIGEEIVDETDLYVDVHKRIAVARARVQLYNQRRSLPEEGAQREERGIGRRGIRRAVSNPEPSISPVEEIEPFQEISLEDVEPADDSKMDERTDDRAPLLIND